MKRLIPIALVAISANAVPANPPMEHVLVSVPLHKKVAKTALPVTVLSDEELRRAAGATIGDTLSNSPGLANASFGPGVGQPVIRGQSGPRVTVLQNGTNSADASNVSADHAASVEPLLADSVEVLRGPATLLYGGGAIGGVVNVLDNRIPIAAPERLQGGAEYRHNTASSGDTAVGRLEGGNGTFAFHLDGLRRVWGNLEIPGDGIREAEDDSERGVMDNSDGETKAFTLGASYHIDNGFFGVAVNRLDNEYGIPPGSHGHHEEEEEEGEEENIRIDVAQTRYDATLHLHEPLNGIEVFRGFLTYTDYGHVELEGGEVGTRFVNETWETRLEVVHKPFGKLHGSFGLQASGGEFSAFGDEAYIPVTDSSELGLYLVEDYHHERITVEGGLRIDWVERNPTSIRADKTDFIAFSAAASLLIELSESWQLGVAAMRAERAPATEELFSNIESDEPGEWVVHAATRSIELGDHGLDTEVSNNLDLSVSWAANQHLFTVNGFYNDFSNYIALGSTGMEVDETPVFRYTNADAEFYGLELESEFALGDLGDGALRLDIKGDMIRGKLDDGRDVPRLPPFRLGAKLNWTSDSWHIYASVWDAAAQTRPGENEEATAGYTRWDAGVEYRLPVGRDGELVVFANLKNISDEEIRLSTSFLRDSAPEPGGSLDAGIRIEF